MDLTDRSILAFVLVSTLAALGCGTSSCTKQELTTAGALVGTGVPAVAQLTCATLTATGQTSAGTACSQDTAALSAVASLVQGILDALPPPAPRMRVLPMAATHPSGFTYKGVTFTFASSEIAAAVQARLPTAASCPSSSASSAPAPASK
jgi:hypothetical protein